MRKKIKESSFKSLKFAILALFISTLCLLTTLDVLALPPRWVEEISIESNLARPYIKILKKTITIPYITLRAASKRYTKVKFEFTPVVIVAAHKVEDTFFQPSITQEAGSIPAPYELKFKSGEISRRGKAYWELLDHITTLKINKKYAVLVKGFSEFDDSKGTRNWEIKHKYVITIIPQASKTGNRIDATVQYMDTDNYIWSGKDIN